MQTIVSQKGQIIIHDIISILKNATIFVAPQFLGSIVDQINASQDLSVYGNIAGLLISLIVKGIEKKYSTNTYVKTTN